MKVIVFGATGGTGRQVVAQVLEAGHEVTAVVRKPEALEVCHERLEIIRGDVLVPHSFEKSMLGHNAVISALGVTHRRPTTLYSEGTANLMKAMNDSGVRRLVCLSSAGLEIPENTPFMQRIVIRLLVQRIYRNAYEDMARMEAKVRSSGLDWTVIRPPRLTNGPRTGTYRTTVNQSLPGARGIARADLADCMIRRLFDNETYRATMEISY
ncbi:NAD(P)-dependent oxidoreductase [Cohnella cholangitidis]|uniref:NAD(P)-dependent oxidoreductase n=1 Tax=Cohnella cholangitidis TaxID=2598458 RepID=UPI0015FC2509|nr:SDR family oxidoreductase [Cohnella cholangitidis]